MRSLGSSEPLAKRLPHLRQAAVSFDRSATELAVRARTIDLAEERLLVAQKMLAVASDLLDRLGAPCEVFNFGGKDNTFSSEVLGLAPAEVRRNAVVTTGIASENAWTSNRHWGKTDFEKVAAAIDTVFRAKGLLK